MSVKPAIVHVSEHPRFIGGIEQNLFALARGLKARGFRQILLYSDDQNQLVDREYLSVFDDAIPVKNWAEIGHKLGTSLSLIFVIQRPFKDKNEKEFLPFVKKYQVVRFVHDHDLVCPRRHKYFPLTKKICTHKAGLNCLIHGCVIGKNSAGKLAISNISKRFEDIENHKKINKLVVASEFMKQSLIKNGFNKNKIEIIPPLPGDIDDNFSPYDENSNEVLFVGQLVRGKGVDLLLRTISRIDRDWKLSIAGDGNMKNELVELAEMLGILDKVEFLGSIVHSEVVRLYKRAAVVVVPSRWPEPFGMVGVEAMAAGRPIVGFAVGGIVDWLWHGVNGFGVSEGNLSGFSESLQWLLDDKKLAKELGENGRKMFEKYYKEADYIEKFEKMLLTSVNE